MTIAKTLLSSLLVLASLAWHPLATAQTATAASAAASAPLANTPGTQYSQKGADTCLSCHDEEADTASFTNTKIFKTKHAQRANHRSPFGPGSLQCEACHGPGANHSDKRNKPKPTINSQKPDSFMGVSERNQPCLDCHQDRTRNAWHDETHNRNHIACADCHKMHVERDPVLSKATEPEVCYGCHRQARADFQKTSAHPLRSGRMACSDCHTTHGSAAKASLNKPTVNQTCFSCHAEKRGPLLWEHAPVAEDCGLCHTAHGSVRPAMLTKSTQALCQDCHSAAGHPSVARTGAALPGNGGIGAIFVVAGSCTNCHSQVHGSNHPAGAKLMR